MVKVGRLDGSDIQRKGENFEEFELGSKLMLFLEIKEDTATVLQPKNITFGTPVFLYFKLGHLGLKEKNNRGKY